MQTPKDVTFPLSEENHLKFHAAREGLMEFVHSESKGFDLKNEDTKKTLRQKTTDNQVGNVVHPCAALTASSASSAQQARMPHAEGSIQVARLLCWSMQKGK